MMIEWKHRKSEQEVVELLKDVARQDPDLLGVFPRRVEDLLALVFAVSFESCRNLSAGTIVQILGDQYGVDHGELLEDGDAQLAGYTFARGEFAVIFSESSFGEEFERFTKAHEAGHLVVEYWPLLARSKQPALFGGEPGPTLYARRDPPGHIFLGTAAVAGREPDDYRKLRANHQAWLREVIANGFAAELLAPYREVGRLAAQLPKGRDLVATVRSRFGLSRSAAETRLTELGLLQGPDTVRFLY